MRLLVSALVLLMGLNAYAHPETEREHIKRYCDSFEGNFEVRHFYNEERYLYVISDCEDGIEVIEGALDNASALTAVQKVLFLSQLTGKRPVVVIFDRDHFESIYEYQVRTVCEQLGIEYRSIPG